jgi:glycolate oxidase iron-sulfur subunit
MQTNLADFIKDTPEGREADAILRTCVHCGFCTATCPTYQLLGDELDGPRGRIYLIKQMLEGQPVSARTQLHLDRCLTCRSCETTCPSGVKYHRLLDIGRAVVEARVPRSGVERLKRFLLREALPRRWLFRPAVRAGQLMRPLLPGVLADKVPTPVAGGARPWPDFSTRPVRHARRMIALAGCVQPDLAPNTNAATARVLDRLGIELFETPGAGCCGALRFHLNAQEAALDDMRRLIDCWWPHIEDGSVEALVMTASGCGAHVREYGELLRHDPAYAEKAARVSALTRDVAEVLAAERARLVELLRAAPATAQKVAFHSPCTLQHGQKIRGVVEALLAAAGCELTPVADPHLCCGSAGTYSILQPELSRQLRDNKLAALGAGAPTVFVTANIGCQTHLQSGSATPVRHWIELIDERLAAIPVR